MCLSAAMAQSAEEELVAFEKKIEQGVVDGNLAFLKQAYADDFRFKHGTGLVDSKATWINTVDKSRGKYLSRVADSVEVEIHDQIGITNGRITVTRKNDQGVVSSYMIKYVRVYRKEKDGWHLFSHRTVFEKHL